MRNRSTVEIFVLRSASPGSGTSWLPDAAGREILDLHHGANDASCLSPGVYFVHSSIANRQSQMLKIVIAR